MHFVRPIPAQYRGGPAVLDSEHVDGVLVGCLVAGVLPMLRDRALPPSADPAAGIMPLARSSRDVARAVRRALAGDTY